MKIIRPVLLALALAIALSVTNRLTAPVIANNLEKYEQRILREMVGSAEIRIEGEGYQYYQEGKLAGYIRTVTTAEGYNGDIDLLVATDAGSRVVSVRVIRHQETPGLGDVIDGDWIRTFDNRGADTRWDLAPQGDFDAITGATITSRAVVNAVNGATIP